MLETDIIGILSRKRLNTGDQMLSKLLDELKEEVQNQVFQNDSQHYLIDTQGGMMKNTKVMMAGQEFVSF